MTPIEKNSPAVKHRFHFLERNYDPSACRVNEGAMDDYESDLRLFALRRAAEEIGSGHNSGNDNSSHRVVVSVQAAPDRGCPMHGRHGSFQLPTSSSLQHQQHQQHSYSHERPSRKEMARELRLSVAREEAAAKAAAAAVAANRSSSYSVERTLSMSGNRGAAVRSYSLEYNNGYNSMPRNSSSNKRNSSSSNVDRRGSFGGSSVTVNSSSSGGGGSGKPVPRDIFRGKLDFKNILRRFDPKEEERSHSARNSVGRSLSGAGGGRYNQDNYGGVGYEEYSYGGVTSPPRSRRGSIVDSDFDFRGGASREPVWDNPGRFRYGGGSATNSAANSRPTSPRPQSQPPQQQVQPSPTRVLKIDVESGNDSEAAAAGVTSNPVSPRRVGFGEQTVFDFDPRRVRSAVSSPVPPANPPQTAKPILRHTSSIEQQQQQQPLSLMDQYERSLPEKKEEKAEDNGDSLVQIYKPPRDSNTEEEEEEDDSDDTLGGGEEDEGKSSPDPKGASPRPVPPPLGECWSRSQSFPPPRTSHENEVLDASAALRKQSLQEEDAAAAAAASSSTAQTRGKRKGRSIGEAITLSALLRGRGNQFCSPPLSAPVLTVKSLKCRSLSFPPRKDRKINPVPRPVRAALP